LAEERTFQEEGLTVEVLAFSSGSRLAQALASDSVDIAIASLNVAMSMINAGQPVKVFYAGISLADFEWFAGPAILGWNGLRGKTIAISTYGSLTDFLTRHVLRKHGLEPGREIQLVQLGEPANLFSALRARRVDAAILLPPFKWQAERLGFTRLGTQAAEVAEEWPRSVFIAKEKFLQDHPDKARAVLRAHVMAIRLLQRDGGAAVQAIMRRLKYDRVYAERAYAEAKAGFDERGRLPAKAMSVFWESAIAGGEAEAPWPDSRYLDRRFMDTFGEWAPK
jgi:NitT/TauT family transport system substrate-binding protein